MNSTRAAMNSQPAGGKVAEPDRLPSSLCNSGTLLPLMLFISSTGSAAMGKGKGTETLLSIIFFFDHCFTFFLPFPKLYPLNFAYFISCKLGCLQADTSLYI